MSFKLELVLQTLKKRASRPKKLESSNARIQSAATSGVCRFRKLQQAEGVGSATKQMGSLAGFQALRLNERIGNPLWVHLLA